MNRNDFNIFIKTTFGAQYNQGRQEWRFRNGDRIYTLELGFRRTNALTFESLLSEVRLFERLDSKIGAAAEDIHETRERVSYAHIETEEREAWTCDSLRTWLVKAVLTHELK